ncbi:GNAT family N-acetyltransferase [Scrofimicrobium canadense]|nr:GNAT family N-acetyltransferase [Scrofimicrobium canadense]
MSDTVEVTWDTSFGSSGCENAFDIRRKTFVDEQGVPYDEVFDARDKEAIHIVGRINESAIACVRCVDEGGGRWRVGWLATHQELRGKGIGTQAMRLAIKTIGEHGGHEVVLSAQGTAIEFYRGLGFEQCGASEDLPSGFTLTPMHCTLKN